MMFTVVVTKGGKRNQKGGRLFFVSPISMMDGARLEVITIRVGINLHPIRANC